MSTRMTASFTIKAGGHLTGTDLATALRAIAEDLDMLIGDSPAISTLGDKLAEFTDRDPIVWALDIQV